MSGSQVGPGFVSGVELGGGIWKQMDIVIEDDTVNFQRNIKDPPPRESDSQ